MPEAKTIKQAKAAYKNRSEQPLTEREQKQLERAVQLDRRAWGIREREKNKLDLAKQRAAQTKALKDEERRIGTQRRNDKFGFKSSQYHLGAFFRKPGIAPPPNKVEDTTGVAEGHSESIRSDTQGKNAGPIPEHMVEFEDDEFEDVDDETLLEALQSPEVARANTTQSNAQVRLDVSMPPPLRPAFLQTTDRAPLLSALQTEGEEIEWHDFLESSTQIEREIGTGTSMTCMPPAHVPPAKEALRNGSFSSGSFELTEDDIEQLDPTPCARAEVEQGGGGNKAADERMKMPPPPNPLKKREQEPLIKDIDNASRSMHFINSMHEPIDLGFSLSQIEEFMEDDLQLTQAG